MKTLVKILMLIIAVIVINTVTAKAQIIFDDTITLVSEQTYEIDTTAEFAYIVIIDSATNNTIVDEYISVHDSLIDYPAVIFIYLYENKYEIRNLDTITHTYIITITADYSTVNTYSKPNGKEKILYKVYTIAGQEIQINNIPAFDPFIYTYTDGTAETKIIIK